MPKEKRLCYNSLVIPRKESKTFHNNLFIISEKAEPYTLNTHHGGYMVDGNEMDSYKWLSMFLYYTLIYMLAAS